MEFTKDRKKNEEKRQVKKKDGLVIWFNDISTIMSYLMSNPVYIYEYMIYKQIVFR